MWTALEVSVKSASVLAIVILSLIAIGHLLRLLFGITVVVGGLTIPLWVSVLGFIFFAAVAIFLWRETRGPTRGS